MYFNRKDNRLNKKIKIPLYKYNVPFVVYFIFDRIFYNKKVACFRYHEQGVNNDISDNTQIRLAS